MRRFSERFLERTGEMRRAPPRYSTEISHDDAPVKILVNKRLQAGYLPAGQCA
jgi:hypothetical protein